ncbi:MAG: helix-turn-helix domain-containing protein [Myxococcota bacterium]
MPNEHVFGANIPIKAKYLWLLIARECDEKNPTVYLNSKPLADKMGCSLSTVSKYLRILIEAGLLKKAAPTKYSNVSPYEVLLTSQAQPTSDPKGEEEIGAQLASMPAKELAERCLSLLKSVSSQKAQIASLDKMIRLQAERERARNSTVLSKEPDVPIRKQNWMYKDEHLAPK